jgi:hypothetical protein
MSKNDSQELKNIKYKSMMLNGNSDAKLTISSDISNIDLFLEKESNMNKNEPWSKLDKTAKLKKLNDYANGISKENKLTAPELKTLKKDFSVYLDKKQLQKAKDVNYDKETGEIKSIPSLLFNKNTRKFTMKRSEKHVSTTKGLGPKKSSTKKAPIKEKKDKIDTI